MENFLEAGLAEKAVNDPKIPSTAGSDEPERFDPDYKYASEDDIRAVTRSHLSKLEVELHTLRMAYIANGRNPNVMIRPNRKIGDEIRGVQHSIDQLEEYFSRVLDAVS